MTAAAGVPMRQGLPHPRDRQGADALRTRLTVDQPPKVIPKHVPRNSHVPGSIAYALVGGRVIR